VADYGVGHLRRVDSRQAVVNTVNVHSGGKDFRISREAERGQISAIRSAPDANPGWIDIGAFLQVLSGRQYVEVFGGAARARPFGELNCLAVADAQTIVHGKHGKTPVRQVLVGPVVVRVLPPVMPAEKHLSWSAAVHVYDRRPAGGGTGAFEQLAVRLDSIACAESH